MTMIVTTPETVINPEAAKTIIDVIINLTQQYAWGVYIVLGFAVLGMLAVMARLIVTATNGKKDDAFFIKWFGWIPTMISAKKANKVVGRGKIDLNSILDLAKRIGNKPSVLIVFIFASLFLISGCSKQINGDQINDVERLTNILVDAQSVIKTVNDNLPLIKEQIDVVCGDTEPPEWCDKIEPAMKDAENALNALQISVDETIELLGLGKIDDPAVVTQKIIKAIIKLSVAYVNVQAIINRH